MPIGSAKIGVLGAGLVPGGTQTFNASGTFTVPPGVKKVNITGKGGTGNPGNAGNAGNPGNPGTGGAGGAGGSGYSPRPAVGYGGYGGWALKDFFCTNKTGYIAPFPQWACGVNQGIAPPALFGPQAPKMTVGGAVCGGVSPTGTLPPVQNNAQSGASGNAGSAGSAGNPGNTGGTSSGLCKNFTGGAGGNAGVAGAAGNGGGGGQGGGKGNNYGNTTGGTAGNGAGAGGPGADFPGPNFQLAMIGVGGGGGAGINTNGSTGEGVSTIPSPSVCCSYQQARYARGGDGCATAPWSCSVQRFNNQAFPSPPNSVPTSMVGGQGAGTRNVYGGPPCAYAAISSRSYGLRRLCSPQPRDDINQFSPVPLAPSLLRAGAGGGGIGGYSFGSNNAPMQYGSGGGGGGRGNAGNAGGNSSAPSGSAANPTTFNCVSVTPGAPYPITVASPGGQIVISWNPQ